VLTNQANFRIVGKPEAIRSLVDAHRREESPNRAGGLRKNSFRRLAVPQRLEAAVDSAPLAARVEEVAEKVLYRMRHATSAAKAEFKTKLLSRR
jgi:hypothetical protein